MGYKVLKKTTNGSTDGVNPSWTLSTWRPHPLSSDSSSLFHPPSQITPLPAPGGKALPRPTSGHIEAVPLELQFHWSWQGMGMCPTPDTPFQLIEGGVETVLRLKIAPDDSNNQLGLEIADTECSEPKSSPSAFQII